MALDLNYKVSMNSFRDFIIAIFVLMAFGSKLQAQTCESLFHIEKVSANSRTLRDYLGISYQDVAPVRGYQNNIGFLRTVSVFHQKPAGTLIRVDVSDFQQSLSSMKNLSVTNRFSSLVEKNIDYVISQYSQRRDWTPEYLEAIRSDAIKFAEHSTYIVAHELSKAALNSEGNIIGTLKVVKGDATSSLPLELDHGIKVPLNGGLKFEPGNFVVLKEESTVGFGEVMSHFVRFAKDLQKNPNHKPDEMVFFTDADRASAMMYKQLGFKPVPGFEKPLIKNGKQYYLIGASTNTVLKFPEIFENSRGEWGRDSTLEKVTQVSGRIAMENALLRFERVEVEQPPKSIYSKAEWEVINRGGLNVYYHLESSGVRLVFGREHGFGKLQFQELLQNSEFPLKSGVLRETRSSSGAPIFETKIEYTQGILRIQRTTDFSRVEVLMETNSDFTDVKSVEYIEDRPGFDRIRIKTQQPPAISYSPPLR